MKKIITICAVMLPVFAINQSVMAAVAVQQQASVDYMCQPTPEEEQEMQGLTLQEQKNIEVEQFQEAMEKKISETVYNKVVLGQTPGRVYNGRKWIDGMVDDCKYTPVSAKDMAPEAYNAELENQSIKRGIHSIVQKLASEVFNKVAEEKLAGKSIDDCSLKELEDAMLATIPELQKFFPEDSPFNPGFIVAGFPRP